MKIDRRDFMRRAVGASGAALLGTVAGGEISRGFGKQPQGSGALPTYPSHPRIEHIVVVTMENRSFDHFLGWATADGQLRSYPKPGGGTESTYALAPDYQGCGHPNPDHSYDGGRLEYNGGTADGWLLDPANDIYSLGYYEDGDLPFLNALARNYLTLDRYFCSFLGPTYPNRIFMLAGQTDRIDNSLSQVSLPTIFDLLWRKRVSVRYYYNNLPFVALWGLRYSLISRTYDRFLDDAASGRLPHVSFVDPRFTILDVDLANDDEPHSNVLRGDLFLWETFNAVAQSPAWERTVFIVTFDEWGGFADHIAPPRVVAPNNVDGDTDTNGDVLLGFRVPAIVASPWTRNSGSTPMVDSTVFDHTSILKLIEGRWGTGHLTARDDPRNTDVGNLASLLTGTYDATVPTMPHPSVVPSSPCFLQGLAVPSTAQPAQPESPWSQLANSPLVKGWRVNKQ